METKMAHTLIFPYASRVEKIFHERVASQVN